jgi:hypothetical protein
MELTPLEGDLQQFFVAGGRSGNSSNLLIEQFYYDLNDCLTTLS